MRRSLVALLLALLLALGCASSPDSRFYMLSPRPGTAETSSELRVQLRRPTLPRQLDTPYLTQSASATRLHLSSDERWGAPLEDMVAETVIQNLSQRLPKALLYTETGAIGVPADVLIEIEFQRFGAASDGHVRLEAHVALRSLAAPHAVSLERHGFVARREGDSAEALVNALSQLLARFSDAVAKQLLVFAERVMPGREMSDSRGREALREQR